MEIFNQEYNLLFIIMSFIALIFSSYNDFKKKLKDYKLGLFFVVFFLICYFFLFGSREYIVGSDTMSYKLIWNLTKEFKFSSEFFTNGLIYLLKVNDYDYRFFLYIFSFMLLVPLFLVIKKVSKENKINPFYFLFCFVSLFFFKSIGINIIRQGVSLSLFLLFISYFNFNQLRQKNIIVYILGCASIVTHNTSIIPILLIIFLMLFKNIKLKHYILLYFFTIILAYYKIGLHSILNNFKILDEKRINLYVNTEDEMFTVGFKPQFVAFNTFFLLLFFLVRRFSIKDVKYEVLLKYYIVVSCLFFLAFQMTYSDRWGIMSWIIIPFLLIPIFTNNFKLKSIKTLTCMLLIFVYTFFTIYFKEN